MVHSRVSFFFAQLRLDDSKVIVGLVVLVLLFFLGKYVFGVLRTKAWKEEAEALGFKYYKTLPQVRSKLSRFKLCNQGHSRTFDNVLLGESKGVQLVLGDYSYTTTSRDSDGTSSSTKHVRTICAVMCPEVHIPHFFLRKEKFLYDYLGSVFGGQDINFEHDSEFSDTFVLQGDNPVQVEKLFSDEIRSYFVENKSTSWQVEAYGPAILVHRGKKLKPSQTRNLMEMTFGVLDIFRQHADVQASDNAPTQAEGVEPQEVGGFSDIQEDPFDDIDDDNFWSS